MRPTIRLRQGRRASRSDVTRVTRGRVAFASCKNSSEQAGLLPGRCTTGPTPRSPPPVMAGFFPVFFQKFWSTGRHAHRNHVAPRLWQRRRRPRDRAARADPRRDRRSRRAPQAIHVRLDLVRRAAPRARCTSSAQGQWFAALALFVLGTMGFNGGIVFNDSLLLDVAQPGELDRVSAFGYSLGYLGGGLLFLVNVLMVQQAGAGSASRTSRAGRAGRRSSRWRVWWLRVHDAADARRARAAARPRTWHSAAAIARRVPRARQHHRAPAPVPHAS